MDEKRHDDLHRMYRLFSQTDLLGLLNDAFNYYIRQFGQKILKEGSSLTEFKKSIEKICLSCFLEDASFEKTAKQCLKDLGFPLRNQKRSLLAFSSFNGFDSAKVFSYYIMSDLFLWLLL